MKLKSPKEGIEETISPKGGEFMNNLEGYLDYLRCPPSRTNRKLSKDEGEEEKMN